MLDESERTKFRKQYLDNSIMEINNMPFKELPITQKMLDRINQDLFEDYNSNFIK